MLVINIEKENLDSFLPECLWIWRFKHHSNNSLDQRKWL